jgi:amidase
MEYLRMKKDVLFRSARSIASSVRSGHYTRKEITTDLLAHIERHNPRLRAFREVASSVSTSSSVTQNGDRLSGVCFSAKDSIPVAGMSLSYGTPDSLLAETSTSATIINLVQSEGAICLGKGNMAEYGKSYITTNSIYGRTANPFNMSYNAGGSSGGDAAGVAAGFVHFAIATDAGGSIRVPANSCGLFGLLPTPGIIPEAGLLSSDDPIATLFRRIGFLTRTLDDLELLMQICTRYIPHDPNSQPQLLGHTYRSTGKFLVVNHIGEMGVTRDIQTELDRVTMELSQRGFTPVHATPREFEHCLKPFAVLAGQAAFLIDGKIVQKKYPRQTSSTQTRILWKLFSDEISSALPPVSLESLLAALHSIHKLRRRILEIFEEVDFILSPVGATGPLKDDTLHKRVGGKSYSLYHLYQYSSVCNVCGLPAIAFPTGKNRNNLPTGLQIIGRRFSEPDLIGVIRTLGYTTSPLEWNPPKIDTLTALKDGDI